MLTKVCGEEYETRLGQLCCSIGASVVRGREREVDVFFVFFFSPVPSEKNKIKLAVEQKWRDLRVVRRVKNASRSKVSQGDKGARARRNGEQGDYRSVSGSDPLIRCQRNLTNERHWLTRSTFPTSAPGVFPSSGWRRHCACPLRLLNVTCFSSSSSSSSSLDT